MTTRSRTSHYPPGPKERFPMQFVLRFGADRLGFLQEMASYGDVSHGGARDALLPDQPA